MNLAHNSKKRSLQRTRLPPHFDFDPTSIRKAPPSAASFNCQITFAHQECPPNLSFFGFYRHTCKRKSHFAQDKRSQCQTMGSIACRSKLDRALCIRSICLEPFSMYAQPPCNGYLSCTLGTVQDRTGEEGIGYDAARGRHRIPFRVHTLPPVFRRKNASGRPDRLLSSNLYVHSAYCHSPKPTPSLC